MRDYSEFDAELLRLIKNGCRTAAQLTNRLRDLAKAIDREAEPFRVVDRQLQALRKKGLIFYSNPVWSTTLS